MKAMIEGAWTGDLDSDPGLRARYQAAEKDTFRRRITADGAGGFKAEPGRYHLYVSYACPWANRTILYRKLKRLDDVVSMSVLHPRWGGPDGWRFGETDKSTRDHVGGRDFLHQVYAAAKPDYTGRVTVPVLWDKRTGTIVSTESGDIIRMFDLEFDQWADASVRFYPDDLAVGIDELNRTILPHVCMGVYKAGFAGTQANYDTAIRNLFLTLDMLEDRLADREFLLGERVTEADWHLFMTLVRFDAVYHAALKCTYRRLLDYPNLSRHTRRLYELPGVARTIRLDHVRLHYFDDLGIGNRRIVAAQPARDFRSAA